MSTEKRKLYVDLDDTFCDTENYLRMMFKQNGIKVSEERSIYDYIGIGECDFLFREGMSDYRLIPKMPGSEDAIRILSTEYEVVFASCYTFPEEAEGKKKLARAMRKNLILCRGTKSHLDMEGGVFIDDNPRHVLESSAKNEDKYVFFNIYNAGELMKCIWEQNGFNPHIVADWYEITNMLMGVKENDAELREHFRKRVSGGC